MQKIDFCRPPRANKQLHLATDLVVAGGGLAGVCAAITAARQGAKVILAQDRPVLGGNASSEVRLWALGATAHMGNNNRWSREGGLIDEILLDNLYRNREGNPLIFDTVLLEKVTDENNITLLLNTAVSQVNKSDGTTIDSIEAFCSQNSIYYQLKAPLFCDATGDGIVAFNAGAAFRVGSESSVEFGEKLAPAEANSELLGHTLYFYSKQTTAPVKYIPPKFALKDITAIPRYKDLSEQEDGCRLWWIEYGGIRDTVYETEEIKWELWKIVYGIWNYIKNSGEFEDVENLTLEWVGTVPGKRESRRFEGDYMLRQQDIVEQTEFYDAVATGGWAIDLHPSEGIYSDLPSCSQWHSKGVYQIPYRCMISRDINNLFLSGRIISTSHMAFGSTRVMLTCAHGSQAVGMAAALCLEKAIWPRQLLDNNHLSELQNRLNYCGQSIPGLAIDKSRDAASKAQLMASSTLQLAELPADGPWISLAIATAQLMPFQQGTGHRFTLLVQAGQATELVCELRFSDQDANYTPDIVNKRVEVSLQPGEQEVVLDFSDVDNGDQYGFLCFLRNEHLHVKGSQRRITGICTVFQKHHKAVSNTGKQQVPGDIGIEEFEFWTPQRRPEGHNLAMKITPPVEAYRVEYLVNGHTRPWLGSNAWVADLNDPQPRIELQWPEPQTLTGLQLHFDTDFDHALESSLMGHPEDRMPFCVKSYRIRLPDGRTLHEETDNYQTINRVHFNEPVNTSGLILELDHPSKNVPAALFEIDCLNRNQHDGEKNAGTY